MSFNPANMEELISEIRSLMQDFPDNLVELTPRWKAIFEQQELKEKVARIMKGEQ